MTFQSDPKTIRWQLHLNASPEQVYEKLSTNDGRALFWAESAMELDKHIQFVFADGPIWRAKIIETKADCLYKIDYVGNTTVTFQLAKDSSKGTILTISQEGVADKARSEAIASWVSILMALKASVEYGIDLRNHDSKYTWSHGFVDN